MTFDFGMNEPTKLMQIIDPEKLPLEIMSPLTLYKDDVIKRIMRDTDKIFNKNDNFRLIFITKSILMPVDLEDGFEVIAIDSEKINEEEII